MTEEWPAYPGLPPTGGFTADPTTAPTLRASNADRAHAAALLDGAYAEGRITATELAERQWGVTAAVTLGDLAPLVADVELPSVADPSSSRLPVPYEPDPLPYRPAMRLTRSSRSCASCTGCTLLRPLRARRGFIASRRWPDVS